MYPVEYEVHVWNDCEGKLGGKEEIVHGITFGETYVEAMEHIEKYYGDELVSVKLYMLEETIQPIYEFEINSNDDFHGMLKIGPVKTYDGY